MHDMGLPCPQGQSSAIPASVSNRKLGLLIKNDREEVEVRHKSCRRMNSLTNVTVRLSSHLTSANSSALDTSHNHGTSCIFPPFAHLLFCIAMCTLSSQARFSSLRSCTVLFQPPPDVSLHDRIILHGHVIFIMNLSIPMCQHIYNVEVNSRDIIAAVPERCLRSDLYHPSSSILPPSGVAGLSSG